MLSEVVKEKPNFIQKDSITVVNQSVVSLGRSNAFRNM